MDPDDADALADDLVEHLQRYELPSRLLREGAVHYLNFADVEQPAATTAGMLALEGQVVARSQMEVRRRVRTDEGFVLQMTSTGVTRAGTAYRVPVCLVVTVEGGLIARIDEYADSEQVKPLLEEVMALHRAGGDR